MKQIASRLIARHGQAATLLRPLPMINDGLGFVPNPDPPTPYPVTVLSATYMVELQFIASGFVEMTDRRVFVAADGLTVTPNTIDQLRIGGEVLHIIRVTSLSPGGEVFFYELQVRDAV
ncbi:MAG: hypothetical protein CVT85_04585 [Alphaproteobacteria bacterium HGW-Alphaproteobacteria-7]|nr:MAG: hypothetical protein CVT85_04585 [Alphaproteobacteria bacterium HGW-Alphaproteobacteria-7]